MAQGAVIDARDLMLAYVESHRWNVTRAARALGVSRDTLRYRIETFALRPPEGDLA